VWENPHSPVKGISLACATTLTHSFEVTSLQPLSTRTQTHTPSLARIVNQALCWSALILLNLNETQAGFFLGAHQAFIEKKTAPSFSVTDATVTSTYSDTTKGYGLSLGYRNGNSPWAIESGTLLTQSPVTITAQSGPVTAEGTATIRSIQIPVLLRWMRFSYLSAALGGYANLPYSIEATGDIEGLTLDYDWGLTAALRFEAPLFKGRVTLSSEFRLNQGIKSFDNKRTQDQCLLVGLTFGGTRK
jgi:hypothetical protein